MNSYDEWFASIVDEPGYLGKDLGREAWNFQGDRIEMLEHRIKLLKKGLKGVILCEGYQFLKDIAHETYDEDEKLING